jgi:hypothetical protein
LVNSLDCCRKENSPDDTSGLRLNGGSSKGLYGTPRFQEYFVTGVIWFREERGAALAVDAWLVRYTGPLTIERTGYPRPGWDINSEAVWSQGEVCRYAEMPDFGLNHRQKISVKVESC